MGVGIAPAKNNKIKVTWAIYNLAYTNYWICKKNANDFVR